MKDDKQWGGGSRKERGRDISKVKRVDGGEGETMKVRSGR